MRGSAIGNEPERRRMIQCTRCGRHHTGICGIPPGVTRGFGARTISSPDVGHTRPRPTAKSTALLDGLLALAKEHYQKVIELLKVMPKEMEEYSEVLDREGKLSALVKQLMAQIDGRSRK